MRCTASGSSTSGGGGANSIPLQVFIVSKNMYCGVQWPDLVQRLGTSYPDAINSCMIDMLNEPDCWGLTWEAHDGYPSAGDLYLAAMDAIYAVNSGLSRPSPLRYSVMSHVPMARMPRRSGCHLSWQP